MVDAIGARGPTLSRRYFADYRQVDGERERFQSVFDILTEDGGGEEHRKTMQFVQITDTFPQKEHIDISSRLF